MRHHQLARIICLLFIFVLVSNKAFAQFGNLKLEVPKSSEKVPLTVGDIDPALNGIPVVFEGVTYEKINEPTFDDFFKSAAKLYGLNVFSTNMCSGTTTQLKNLAHTLYADSELKKSIDEMTNNTPEEEWTVEQRIAIVKLGKLKKKLTVEQIQYFVTTGGYLTLVGASLAKGVQSVGDLVEQGSKLVQNVTSLPVSKVLAATSATKACIENLDNFQSSVPPLVKEVYALGSGFSMILASDADASSSSTTTSGGSIATSESKSTTSATVQKTDAKDTPAASDKAKESERSKSADASKGQPAASPAVTGATKKESSASLTSGEAAKPVSTASSPSAESSRRLPIATYSPGEVSKGVIIVPSYVNARAAFNSKKYDEAIRTLQQLLDTKVSQNLSGHCEYWIGESYFGKRDFAQAVKHFEVALQANMPEKMADAHFMTARCYEFLKDNARAKEHFEVVAKEFPNTDLAQLALKHLRTL